MHHFTEPTLQSASSNSQAIIERRTFLKAQKMSQCHLDCEHCKADGVPCLALLVTTWFQFQVAQHKHLDHQILVMCVLMPVLLLFSFNPKPLERHYASQNR
jgi:hypothetical protein